MAGVVQKFFIASAVMWLAPLAIMYAFNYHLIPGSTELSSSTHTLLSGFLAVVSVNMVIAYYVYMAMKEPVDHNPQPDPAFVAKAKASINQPSSSTDDKHHED